LPLQLHLDQGQLNFLISFFQNDLCNNPNLACENENIDAQSTMYRSDTIADEALLPFFQKFDVKPLVLHINYIPRHFDPVALSKGNYAELLNIFPWKGIDLKLKQVSAMGVYGFNNICEIVAAEWLEDISKNQVLIFPHISYIYIKDACCCVHQYRFRTCNAIRENLKFACWHTLFLHKKGESYIFLSYR
jgi:autophagy-related protein 2